MRLVAGPGAEPCPFQAELVPQLLLGACSRPVTSEGWPGAPAARSHVNCCGRGSSCRPGPTTKPAARERPMQAQFEKKGSPLPSCRGLSPWRFEAPWSGPRHVPLVPLLHVGLYPQPLHPPHVALHRRAVRDGPSAGLGEPAPLAVPQPLAPAPA